MKSDLIVEKVDLVPGFELSMKMIATLQASREEPRKLVSTFVFDNKVIMVFELV